MAEEIAFEDAFLNGNNEQQLGLSQGSNQVSDGCTYDGTGSSASDSSESESDESPESEKRHRRKKNAYTSDSEIEDRRYRPRKKTRRYKSSRYESDSESESESESEDDEKVRRRSEKKKICMHSSKGGEWEEQGLSACIFLVQKKRVLSGKPKALSSKDIAKLSSTAIDDSMKKKGRKKDAHTKCLQAVQDADANAARVIHLISENLRGKVGEWSYWADTLQDEVNRLHALINEQSTAGKKLITAKNKLETALEKQTAVIQKKDRTIENAKADLAAERELKTTFKGKLRTLELNKKRVDSEVKKLTSENNKLKKKLMNAEVKLAKATDSRGYSDTNRSNHGRRQDGPLSELDEYREKKNIDLQHKRELAQIEKMKRQTAVEEKKLNKDRKGRQVAHTMRLMTNTGAVRNGMFNADGMAEFSKNAGGYNQHCDGGYQAGPHNNNSNYSYNPNNSNNSNNSNYSYHPNNNNNYNSYPPNTNYNSYPPNNNNYYNSYPPNNNNNNYNSYAPSNNNNNNYNSYAPNNNNNNNNYNSYAPNNNNDNNNYNSYAPNNNDNNNNNDNSYYNSYPPNNNNNSYNPNCGSYINITPQNSYEESTNGPLTAPLLTQDQQHEDAEENDATDGDNRSPGPCNLPTIPDTALNNTRTNFRTDRSMCEVQASQSATMPLKKRQTHE